MLREVMALSGKARPARFGVGAPRGNEISTAVDAGFSRRRALRVPQVLDDVWGALHLTLKLSHRLELSVCPRRDILP